MARAPQAPLDEEEGGAEEQSDAVIKAQLKFARADPVGCAVLIDQDKQAIIRLARNRTGKNLAGTMKREDDDAKVVLFGTAKVDLDNDPKKVTFTLNKTPGGLERALKLALKTTGYNKVEVVKG